MLKNHLIDDVVCEIPVCEYQERLARTKERMKEENFDALIIYSNPCLLYTSPSPRDS